MRGWEEQGGALGFDTASISVSGFTHSKPNDTRSSDEPFPCSGCVYYSTFPSFLPHREDFPELCQPDCEKPHNSSFGFSVLLLAIHQMPACSCINAAFTFEDWT